MTKIHTNNVGKTVTVGEVQDTIESVSASGQFFRLTGEKNGPLVYDYTFEDVAAAEELIVSFKESVWVKVSINPTLL